MGKILSFNSKLIKAKHVLASHMVFIDLVPPFSKENLTQIYRTIKDFMWENQWHAVQWE